jgi:hypothetical protein
MNKLEYTQWVAYYSAVVSKANAGLKGIQDKYIKSNAPHPVGSIVTVLDGGEKLILRIEDYDIKDGLLIPVFVTLEDKCKFLSVNYVIIE